MQVVIPVAGYATRLYPLTKDKPKALLAVKGKPILEHIIHRIGELPEIEGIFIVTNEKFSKNFTDWAQSFRSEIPIEILNDGTASNEDRLGQIGDIEFAIEKGGIDSDLLIIAGDNLFNFSLLPVYNFFKERKCILNALYDIKSIEAARELGVMAIDPASNLVVSFEEKPQSPKSTNVSLGIYFFPRESVAEIKRFLESGGKPDKIGYLMASLTQEKKLYGFVYREKWFDIGVPAALKKAEDEFRP